MLAIYDLLKKTVLFCLYVRKHVFFSSSSKVSSRWKRHEKTKFILHTTVKLFSQDLMYLSYKSSQEGCEAVSCLTLCSSCNPFPVVTSSSTMSSPGKLLFWGWGIFVKAIREIPVLSSLQQRAGNSTSWLGCRANTSTTTQQPGFYNNGKKHASFRNGMHTNFYDQEKARWSLEPRWREQSA